VLFNEYNTKTMRIGNGYDIHRLVENRDLILGGVSIPFEKGLLGHSDADVLTHAIMDALLGALALGDIGQYFPPTDEKWRGANSLVLLQKVMELVKTRGYCVHNLDTVIVAEAPKMRPHIIHIQEKLATAMGITAQQVGVKATTQEGLGPIGEGLAICAYAVVLLEEC
jgi:2-C-methyl-D-erythritol 2,4-cyclodiphosphate synthase